MNLLKSQRIRSHFNLSLNNILGKIQMKKGANSRFPLEMEAPPELAKAFECFKEEKCDSATIHKKNGTIDRVELNQKPSTDTSFVRYCRYGLSLLTHLDVYYQEASPPVQKKLLGSIFTGKLIFEDGKYRTTGLNEPVTLIGLFQKDL